ncbi:MAG: mevalonate kinase [Woeseiaceae bacterium]
MLSNLADRRIARARCTIPISELGFETVGQVGNLSYSGEEVRDGIIAASAFAAVDPYRAATHNKGIMNGVDALAIATGNDWRALEAGVHAYAARDGSYRALTRWGRAADGGLRGELTLPLKLGTVGGSLRANPAAVAGLCIAGVESARELGELAAAVGLAQNLAALRALVSGGIQKGHMRLHARSVAAAAGIPAQHAQAVVGAMIESGEIREWKARQLLEDIEAGARVRDAGRKARGSGNAAGKVILLGEHAVVYGYTAIALPLESAVTARVYEAHGGIRLRIADWDIDQSVDRDHATGAAETLALILRRLGLDEESLLVEVDARVPPAMGLGSSAALAVAIIRALDDAFRLGMGDDAVNELAFDCEKLAHGTPSGIDNVVAVSGKPIVYCRDGNPRVRPMSLPSRPPLVVAASGTRGETRAQVESLRQLYDAQPDVVEAIFRAIDGISRQGAAALQAADYARLGRLMNICHGLLNALQVSTPLLEEMIDIARAHGALGAKLTGAGGGGSIVALCPGRAEAVARALDGAGFRIIEDTGN